MTHLPKAATTADAYAAQHTTPLNELQQRVLNFTLAHHPKHHMISGAVQGQFLRLFSLAVQPKRVLEIGTFTGFSALCLADGLVPDGLLYTLECRHDDASTAQDYFNQSPHHDKIKLLIGDALSTLPLLHDVWDLVFLDADKTGYVAYYEQIMPQLRPGGFILADNVLFHGEVLEVEIKGKNAKAIHAFNQHVLADSRVEQVLLTQRDGLTLLRKR